VTQRDKLRGLLGGLNASDARGRKNIAFCDFIFGNQLERLATKSNFARRNCCACAETSTIRALPSAAMWVRRRIDQPPIATILRFGL